jgi:hypothetical protein
LKLKKDNNNLGSNEHCAWDVVDYYIKHFRAKSGPILMDKGVEKTKQGTVMEIAKSSKPITYVGLDSCIGLTVKGKIGVHLVTPFENQQIYIDRVKDIEKVCGTQKLLICAKTSADVTDHVNDVVTLMSQSGNCPDAIKWLSNKIKDKEYSARIGASGTVTVD